MFKPHAPQVEKAVPGISVAVPAKMADPVVAHSIASSGTGSNVLPGAGSGDVTVGSSTSVAGLPLSAAAQHESGPQADVAAPSKLHIQVLDQAAARGSGINGVEVKVHRSDGGTAVGPVSLDVNYSSFRDAFGGGWADRLELVQLPQDRPVPSTNDEATGHLTAQVQAGAADTTFALVAAAASTGGGGSGDYSASTLAAAGSWAVGSQGGDFTYSYPMRVPSVPGGLEPTVAASYDSGSTDGETYSTNNQTSWVGEGWSLGAGSITRGFETCSTAGGGRPNTDDECWVTDNATLTLGGKTSELIQDSNGGWHLRDDDGSRVQHLTRNDGSADPEYWVVTTTDGTQYTFGLGTVAGRSTGSAWTVPVFGNGLGAGESCPSGQAWCQRVWQWNLDYVVDPHGDSMTYFYNPETNAYGLNMGAQTVPYTRGGTLARIEYGTRAGSEYSGSTSNATAVVTFNTCDREQNTKTCDRAALNTAIGGNAANFLDVPTDQSCSTACTTQVAPTFWSTQRLGSVTTSVTTASGTANVDSWTFDQLYPDPGDKTPASLWLNGVIHTGLAAGGSIALPETTFAGTTYPNLVSNPAEGQPPLNKYRIIGVDTESGGQTAVSYLPTDCTVSALPTPDSNTQRCFPGFWQPPGAPARTDWFAKYVVHTITNTDLVGSTSAQLVTYVYPPNGGAWAFNDNPLVPAAQQNWDQWRGFAQVSVVGGDPTDTNATQTSTEYRYYRGLNGDHQSNGSTTSASFTNPSGFGSAPTSVPDNFQDAGFLGEKITFKGVGGPVVTDEVRVPVQYGPAATNGTHQSWLVAEGKDVVSTTLSSGGPRLTEVDTSYTPQGLPNQVSDLGDRSASADDRCTNTTYAANTTTWIQDLPEEVISVGATCGSSPSLPAQAISDVRTSYDGGAPGAAPTRGDATKVEKVTSYTGGTANYTTQATSQFDQYGRVTSVSDAMIPPRTTTTTYTPAAGIPTSSVVTDPAGFTTTTTTDPSLGQPTAIKDVNGRETDLTYDALGRLTKVWKPGQSKARGDTANLQYTYKVSNTPGSPNAVGTETLEANGNVETAYTLYDGFLRARQTQSPALDGSGQRILTDAFYNSLGQVWKTNGDYVATGAPSTSLFAISDLSAASQTRTTYDGAGRATVSTFYSKAVPQWATTTAYGGDHVDVTPPSGGTPSTNYTDARGQTTEVRQYTGSLGGAYQDTKYSYTPAGDLATIKDNYGNTWTYGYDVSGNRTSVGDPDTGPSSAAFDLDNEQISSKDANGNILTYTYDPLGRKTGEYQGQTQTPGNLLIGYSYDTLPYGKDMPASTTRHIGADTYTSAVTGYDQATGLIAGTSITIPASQGNLAGTYSSSTTYNVDGSIYQVTEPQIGDLPSETVTYSYDSFSQVTGVSTADATILNNTTYTAFGEPTQYAFGPVTAGANNANAWQSLYYDEATRRPIGDIVERNLGAAEVDDTNYTYNDAGEVTSDTDIQPNAANDTQCFSYDGLDELAQAWTDTGGALATDANGNPVSPGTPTPSTGRCTNTTPAKASIGGPAPYWQSYGYDLIGDRTTTTSHSQGSAPDSTTTYSFATLGKTPAHSPQSATTTTGSNTSTVAYSYDTNGDTTSRPAPDSSAQTLSWDGEDHLGSVTTDGKTSNYIYNTDGGLLISKDVTGSTLYLPNGEVHASTTGAVTGTRYYTTGSITLAVQTSAGIEYQINDPHGTSMLSLDSTTLAASQRRYDPFGNLRQTTGTAWPDDKGFVNGTADPTDGLTRLGARDYDPTTGRFISPDPLLNPTDPTHLNAYAYADDNPTTFSDPTGLITRPCPDGDCVGLAPNTTSPAAPPPPPVNRFPASHGGANSCPDRDCFDNHVTHSLPRMGDGNRLNCPDGSCNPYFTLAPGLRPVSHTPTLPSCTGTNFRFAEGCDPNAPVPSEYTATDDFARTHPALLGAIALIGAIIAIAATGPVAAVAAGVAVTADVVTALADCEQQCQESDMIAVGLDTAAPGLGELGARALSSGIRTSRNLEVAGKIGDKIVGISLTTATGVEYLSNLADASAPSPQVPLQWGGPCKCNSDCSEGPYHIGG